MRMTLLWKHHEIYFSTFSTLIAIIPATHFSTLVVNHWGSIVVTFRDLGSSCRSATYLLGDFNMLINLSALSPIK